MGGKLYKALLWIRLVVFRAAGIWFLVFGVIGALVALACLALALFAGGTSELGPWWAFALLLALCWLFAAIGLKAWRLRSLRELEEQAADLGRMRQRFENWMNGTDRAP